ncbi:MAG: DUF177 domain-containing protein [Myxococcales bacterium FL481]|nr:MAG: DUF177 domain-containing protein [Myxococcales bacterium FL481]
MSVNHQSPDDAREATRDAMVIALDRLREDGSGGLSLDVELSSSFVSEALAKTDARADQAGRLDAHIWLQADGTVLVRGRLHATFAVPCARCLADAMVDAGADLCVTFVPRGEFDAQLARRAGDSDDGVELDADDLDQFPYEGTSVDLSPLIREQIHLAYPMRALCGYGEACRGLCPACGANLNEGPVQDHCPKCHAALGSASAESEEPPPAWKAALEKLRGNN